MINRSSVIVKVKLPFLEWLNQLPDPVGPGYTLERLNEEPNIYLIPEWDDDADRDRLLRKEVATIFESELMSWWTQESDWPEKRDFGVFKKWFDFEFCSIVEDLVDEPLFSEA